LYVGGDLAIRIVRRHCVVICVKFLQSAAVGLIQLGQSLSVHSADAEVNVSRLEGAQVHRAPSLLPWLALSIYLYVGQTSLGAYELLSAGVKARAQAVLLKGGCKLALYGLIIVGSPVDARELRLRLVVARASLRGKPVLDFVHHADFSSKLILELLNDDLPEVSLLGAPESLNILIELLAL